MILVTKRMAKRKASIRQLAPRCKHAVKGLLGVVLSLGVLMPVYGQRLVVSVTKLNDHSVVRAVNAGQVSQSVTDPEGVAVFVVRVRRHGRKQRTLTIDAVFPSITVVRKWHVAYSSDTDSPATAISATLPITFTIASKQSAGSNFARYYFYIHADVNVGSTTGSYSDNISLTATYAESS